jgi:hypothetical protein
MFDNIFTKKFEINQNDLITEKFFVHLIDHEGMNIATYEKDRYPTKAELSEMFIQNQTARRLFIEKFFLPTEGEAQEEHKQALERIKHNKKTDLKFI